MKHLKNFLFLLTFLSHASLLPMRPVVKNASRLATRIQVLARCNTAQPARLFHYDNPGACVLARRVLPDTDIKEALLVVGKIQGEYESFDSSLQALEHRKKLLLDYHVKAGMALCHLRHNKDHKKIKEANKEGKRIYEFSEKTAHSIWITRKQIEWYEVRDTINGVPVIFQKGDYIS
jgi:hypothetical protein